jgi:hypothetical protein
VVFLGQIGALMSATFIISTPFPGIPPRCHLLWTAYIQSFIPPLYRQPWSSHLPYITFISWCMIFSVFVVKIGNYVDFGAIMKMILFMSILARMSYVCYSIPSPLHVFWIMSFHNIHHQIYFSMLESQYYKWLTNFFLNQWISYWT